MARIRPLHEFRDGRRSEARRFDAVRAEYLALLEERGPVSKQANALVLTLSVTDCKLEVMASQISNGEPVDAGELTRLGNLQRRLLRQLRLIGDIPRETTPRYSQSARNFVEEMERKQSGSDAEPDEMALYIKGRQARTARLARRIGVDVVLIERGLIDETEARAAYKAGDTKALRKMIATAKAAWATRDAPIEATDDDLPAPVKPHPHGSPIKRISA